MDENNTRASRIIELDSLRGVAALVIAFDHFSGYLKPYMGEVEPFSFWWVPYRVHFLLMVAGFVIFLTIKKTDTIWDFSVKRLARLTPSFWASVLICWLILQSGVVDYHRVIPVSDMLLNFTMVPRLFQVESVNGAYWTIMVILGFYGMVGMLIATKSIHKLESIIYSYLFVLLVKLILEHIWGDLPSYTINIIFFKYIEYFMIGAAYYLWFTKGLTLSRGGIILTSYLIGVYTASRPVEIWFISALVITFGLLINHKLKFLAWRPLLFCGAISYPLYLVHHSVGQGATLALYNAGVTPFIASMLSLIGIVILSVVIQYGIADPTNKWIRLWWQSRTLKKIGINNAPSDRSTF